MDQVRFVSHLKDRGWQPDIRYNGSGPVYRVTGLTNGQRFMIYVQVPALMQSDHSQALSEFYDVLFNKAILNPSREYLRIN